MSDHPKCPVCICKIIDTPKCCGTCNYPHHPECWESNEGCGVKECKPKSVVVNSSRPSDDSSLMEYVLLLVTFIMFSWLAIITMSSTTTEIYGNTMVVVDETKWANASLDKNEEAAITISDPADDEQSPDTDIEDYSNAITEDLYALALDRNNLAYTYAENDTNLDEAMGLVDEALAVESGDPYFLDTKGWIYYKQGQLKNAGLCLERALASEPDNETILDHYMEVWTKIVSLEDN